MSNPPVEPTTKHPGDRLATYFETFFKGFGSIATLGASLTFSKIVQSPVPPFHDYGFSSQGIQYLLATSWLLFVITLAFTSLIASALSLWRPQAVLAFGTKDSETRRQVLWFASGTSALLLGLTVAAFLTLALVVVAYVGPVGWVAVVFTVLLGMLGFGAIIWQSPLGWPKRLTKSQRRELETLEAHLPRARGSMKREHDSDLTREQQGRSLRQHSKEPNEGQRGYGRSTSGDHAGGRWRHSQKDESHTTNRYSKASTIISDAYGPGIYGQREVTMYDDGVREGLVVGEYAR